MQQDRLSRQLDAIGESEIAKIYCPLSLNELADRIISGSEELENPGYRVAIKSIIDAKLANIHAFTEFVYLQTLSHIGLRGNSYGTKHVGNEEEVIKELSSKHVFPKQLYQQFADTKISAKEYAARFGRKGHPLEKRLHDVRLHFKANTDFYDGSIGSLAEYAVNLKIDRFKDKSKLLFGIRKEKVPYRIARKKALQQVDNAMRQKKNKPQKPEVIDDVGGFMLCASESLYVGEEEAKNHILYKLLDFFGSNHKTPYLTLDFIPETDDYYINNRREMEGIQAYVRAPDIGALYCAGFALPYPQVAGTEEDHYKKNFVTSIHLQGPRAFLNDRIGKTAHGIYVMRKESKIEEKLSLLPREENQKFHATVEVLEKYFWRSYPGINLTTVPSYLADTR